MFPSLSKRNRESKYTGLKIDGIILVYAHVYVSVSGKTQEVVRNRNKTGWNCLLRCSRKWGLQDPGSSHWGGCGISLASFKNRTDIICSSSWTWLDGANEPLKPASRPCCSSHQKLHCLPLTCGAQGQGQQWPRHRRPTSSLPSFGCTQKQGPVEPLQMCIGFPFEWRF